MGNPNKLERPKVKLHASDGGEINRIVSEDTDLDVAAERGGKVGDALLVKRFSWKVLLALVAFFGAAALTSYFAFQDDQSPTALPPH